jgi:hypothetical protein
LQFIQDCRPLERSFGAKFSHVKVQGSEAQGEEVWSCVSGFCSCSLRHGGALKEQPAMYASLLLRFQRSFE